MSDPIYRAPAPLIDEQYEALAGEPMPEPSCPDDCERDHEPCDRKRWVE